MSRTRRVLACTVVTLALVAALGGAAVFLGRYELVPLPSVSDLANPGRLPPDGAADVMGRSVDADQLAALPPEQRPAAVPIDGSMITRGRDAFYRETYRDELFLSDVMGLLDNAITPWEVTRSLVQLAGRGTGDLKVRLARDVTIGDHTLRAGTLISTGLDVPRGGLLPLGVKVQLDRGRIRTGITCALCHASVDGNGKVVEGAPNTDLQAGLLMALSANPAAYFIHTGVASLQAFQTDPSRTVPTSDGKSAVLPDPQAMADAARAMLAAWPPGSFDSSPDLVNNPTSIPSSFTRGGHPFGWSGHASLGPFRGLTALNNNVHSLNSDETAQAAAAPVLFGIDPELYLGTLLQAASSPRLRYDPRSGRKPSDVLAAGDPDPGIPGLNTYAVLPDFPKANLFTSNSLVATRPGEPVGAALNAMSAFQDVLRPPGPSVGPERAARGRAVFERAGCAGCHAGPALTDNRVHPVGEIGTEPSRARSFARASLALAPPLMFRPDAPNPPPAEATLPVPTPPGREEDVRLAWAEPGTEGGYKVPALVGLAWTAPYLHDGSVAADIGGVVGPDVLYGTTTRPDPAASLRVLVDRTERDRLIAAHATSARSVEAHVSGRGHAFWADEQSGFSRQDQGDLVAYLLSVVDPRSGDARSRP